MMIAPLVLFVSSLAVLAWSAGLPAQSDIFAIAVLCALASLFLLVRAAMQRAQAPKPGATRPINRPKWGDLRRKLVPKRYVVVDGSNVMHWQDNVPQIGVLRDVLGVLAAKGFTAMVVFDANAGHKLNKGYQHDGALGRMIGLPESQVIVVDRGTPADPRVLAAARVLGARVVSNDRFRDWQKDFPEVAAKGHLIRGAYRGKDLWLDLD